MAIAAVIMVAGAITFVACNKDINDNETQAGKMTSLESKMLKKGIPVAEYTHNGISLLFNKDTAMANIQKLMKDSLGMNCVMEDIRVYDVLKDSSYAHLIAVSYFDLQNEVGVSLFGTLSVSHHIIGTNAKLYLASGGMKRDCIGVNCKKGCEATLFKMPSGELIVGDCSPCTAAIDISKPYSCKSETTQELVSKLIYNSIELSLI